MNTRVQLEMPPKAMERLRALKERTEAMSYAEVLRMALIVYERYLNGFEKRTDRGSDRV